MNTNWKYARIGEVCDVFNGSTPSRNNPMYWNGEISWFTVKDIRDQGNRIRETSQHITEEGLKSSSLTIVPPRTVLICCTASVGEYAITEIPLTFNQQFNGMVVKDPEQLSPEFLYLLASTFKERLLSVSGKMTIDFVSMKKLKDLIIPIPPLPEQKRIVSILDEALAAIDQAQANVARNLQNADEIYLSELEELFKENRSTWRTTTLLQLLDDGWIVSHLDGNHGGDYPRKDEFVKSGVPYISANCLKDGKIDFSLAKFLTPERASTLRKGIAQNRDVIFAHNATVGPVTLLRTDEPKVILSTSLTYYRCNPSYILPEYLVHYMRSKRFIDQYEQVMEQSTRNQVPITKQRTFFHTIPSLEEQRGIVPKLDTIISGVDRLKPIYYQKLNELVDLKKAILQKAFTGELTENAILINDE